MDFLKNALSHITGELHIGDFAAVAFGGDKGISATASGRVTTGNAPPLTSPETSILLFAGVGLVILVLLLRR